MSLQLSNLEFFYLSCISYRILDEQVGDFNKPGNLVD